MKRSEINNLITRSKLFFKEMNFFLPQWSTWSPADWQFKQEICQEIIENNLGWDITDFGLNDFNSKGLILFTIRNGNTKKDKKPYCEKIMICDVNQETPMHFHWKKQEDIINRGGGQLVM